MTSTIERTISTVVGDIANMLSDTNPIGVCVEPIATMSDPHDDIKGDYNIRACYWSDLPEAKAIDPSKRYCIVFEASMVISNVCRLQQVEYVNMMNELRNAALSYRDSTGEGKEHVVTTSNGVVSLGDVTRRARRGPIQ